VFEPAPAPLAALSCRVKEAFDPAHILNPGRMYPHPDPPPPPPSPSPASGGGKGGGNAGEGRVGVEGS